MNIRLVTLHLLGNFSVARGGGRGGGFFGGFLVTRYCTKYLYLHHVQEALQIPNDFWFKSCSLEMRKCQ